MSAKLTPWFPMHLHDPAHDGDYEFRYVARDIGFCPVYRASFRAPHWYSIQSGYKLPGLNEDPENFKFRGLTSNPAEPKP